MNDDWLATAYGRFRLSSSSLLARSIPSGWWKKLMRGRPRSRCGGGITAADEDNASGVAQRYGVAAKIARDGASNESAAQSALRYAVEDARRRAGGPTPS
ncbi:hypothetical protein [Mycobacterium heckeshornense]|uniref:hypothetical protein n=1 Tax=Mycobacterium heckeshornense TaxID=110505 RepID=UPI0006626DA3|nr:hypothetical protein [Mycobacterium heckeshornense]KMV22600.1 hypothetical protein ACT16_09965 [Mycobacterium heckeshornense]MCV7034249.1 hypothetical protein [Mycobacterium heckeshornense]